MNRTRTLRRPTVLQVAAHEAGHAIARWATDDHCPYPGPFIREITVIPNGDVLGGVHNMNRVNLFTAPVIAANPACAELLPGMRRGMRLDLVATLAGPVAEIRWRGGWLAPWWVRGEMVRQVLTAPPHDGEGNLTDAQHVMEIVAFLAPPDPKALVTLAWTAASAVVEAEWPGIARAARQLAAAGTMQGADMEEEWRRRRQSAAAREKRALSDHAEALAWAYAEEPA